MLKTPCVSKLNYKMCMVRLGVVFYFFFRLISKTTEILSVEL